MDGDNYRLGRILSDRTRVEILNFIDREGNASYVDIQRTVGIQNTGKLNYHLKILNELLGKNDEGKYFLTDLGRHALAMLDDYGNPDKRRSRIKIERMRGSYLAVAATIPVTFYLSYMVFGTSLLYLLIYGINSYFMLGISYVVWKRAYGQGKLPGSERIRRFAFMYIFAVIFFFLNIFIMISLEGVYPAIASYPVFLHLIIGIMPGTVSGILVGNFVGKYLTYHAVLWFPI